MRYLDLIRDITGALRPRYGMAEATAIATRVVEDVYGVTTRDLLDPVRQLEAHKKGKQSLKAVVNQLLQGVPVQYVLGHTYFMGHRFLVGPGVLIPRPETEELTQHILRHVSTDTGWEALDLCTGSGCIAISLALAGGRVVAVANSALALGYARRNRHVLGGQVRFFCRDVLEQRMPAAQQGGYAVVVCNPPYVPPGAVLCEHVRKHEPAMALFTDDIPRWYRCIAAHASKHLLPNGMVFVETHIQAIEQIQRIFVDAGFQDVVIQEDLFDKPRFVWGRWMAAPSRNGFY